MMTWISFDPTCPGEMVTDAMTPADANCCEYDWLGSDGRGDCEDYALTKQKKLMEMGFSVRALRLAVVDTPQREGHVVLTVVTDRGDYVLDNRSPWVLPWRKADYIWFKRQDPDHALAWVQLDPRPGPILTSAAGLSCPDLSLHG